MKKYRIKQRPDVMDGRVWSIYVRRFGFFWFPVFNRPFIDKKQAEEILDRLNNELSIRDIIDK